MDIRRARPQDAALISALNVEVQELHAQAKPHLFKPPAGDDFAAPFFAQVLADPDHHAFVAYDDGEPAGYIYAQRIARPENPFRPALDLLYIHHLCVTRARRRQGIGRALVGRVVALARELGIERVELDVWTFNEAARAAFAAMGFSAYNVRLVYDRDLGDEPCAR